MKVFIFLVFLVIYLFIEWIYQFSIYVKNWSKSFRDNKIKEVRAYNNEVKRLKRLKKETEMNQRLRIIIKQKSIERSQKKRS